MAVSPPHISYAMSDETATVSTVTPNARPVVMATATSSAVTENGFRFGLSRRKLALVNRMVDQVRDLVE